MKTIDLSRYTTSATKDQKSGVSIIVPVYRAAPFIEECLDSVYNQTYIKNGHKYEVLVGVDGCVETKKKVLEIKNKYDNLRVYWFPENNGAYKTRNTLAYKTNYNHLIFFDADDIMSESLISKSVVVLKDFDIVRYMYMNFGEGNWAGRRSKEPAPGVFGIKVSVFKELGGFLNFPVAVDDEFRDRAIRLGYKTFAFMDEDLFSRRRHKKSLTGDPKTTQGSDFRNKCIREIRKLGFIRKAVPILGECEEI